MAKAMHISLIRLLQQHSPVQYKQQQFNQRIELYHKEQEHNSKAKGLQNERDRSECHNIPRIFSLFILFEMHIFFIQNEMSCGRVPTKRQNKWGSPSTIKSSPHHDPIGYFSQHGLDQCTESQRQ